MTCAERDDAARELTRPEWACALGLLVWIFLVVAFVVCRAIGVYRTPWLVVLAPVWIPPAIYLVALGQLFARFGLWVLWRLARMALRLIFPWERP